MVSLAPWTSRVQIEAFRQTINSHYD